MPPRLLSDTLCPAGSCPGKETSQGDQYTSRKAEILALCFAFYCVCLQTFCPSLLSCDNLGRPLNLHASMPVRIKRELLFYPFYSCTGLCMLQMPHKPHKPLLNKCVGK